MAAPKPLVPPLPACGRAIAYGSLLGGGNARAACSTSPRVRGEVDLRAEPLRSEANRVRGLVHKLRLAATPPHRDSVAPLHCARNPPPDQVRGRLSPRMRGEVGFRFNRIHG